MSESANIKSEKWPLEAFGGADPANRFSFSVSEGTGYFAFGQVDPVPFGVEAPKESTVSVRAAVAVSPSLLLAMRDTISKFIEENPAIFGKWQTESDPANK